MWWTRELLVRKRLQCHNLNAVTMASTEPQLLWERGCVVLLVTELLRHYEKLLHSIFSILPVFIHRWEIQTRFHSVSFPQRWLREIWRTLSRREWTSACVRVCVCGGGELKSHRLRLFVSGYKSSKHFYYTRYLIKCPSQ
jgi:hypothetical protein